jgi:predicted RNA-binding Zn ribbon-like protein
VLGARATLTLPPAQLAAIVAVREDLHRERRRRHQLLDRSRAHRRRWCSMLDCGNAARSAAATSASKP